MPKIQQHTVIDVTPEKFLNACDSTELQELELLLSKPEYQEKMGRSSNSDLRMLIESYPLEGAFQTCHQCGCTDQDCTGCIERTGEPCHWVAPNLCSACVANSPLSKIS